MDSLKVHISASAPIRRTIPLLASLPLSPPSPTSTSLQRHLLFWIPRWSTSSKLPRTLSQALDSTFAPLFSIPDDHCIFTFAIVIIVEPQWWGWMRIKIRFSAHHTEGKGWSWVKSEVLSPNNFKKADESLLIGIRTSRLSLASLFYQSKTANRESNLHVLSIYYLPGPLLGA